MTSNKEPSASTTWPIPFSAKLKSHSPSSALFVLPDSASGKPEVSYPESGLVDSDRENSGFWVSHRNEAIQEIIAATRVSQLVEVGAGSGAVCSFLDRQGYEVMAIEPHLAGAEKIAAFGITSIAAVLSEVEFASNSVPSFGLFDVLEHLPEPEKILKEIHRTLKPNGYVFVSVPIGQWLWGAIDDTVGHKRRYSRRNLIRLLEQSGFKVERCRYLFLALVPLAFFTRALPYRLGRRKSDINSIKAQLAPGLLVTKLVSTVLAFESKVHLPYGLSLLAAATKVADS